MQYLLIVIGLFTSYLTGAQDWAPVGEVNQAINSLYADTIDNRLYVGGPFRYYNGIETRGIFSLNTDGTVNTLGSAQDGCGPFNCMPVKAITRYKDEIYISWTNTTIGGGIIVNGVARWDNTTWKPVGNDPISEYATVVNFVEHEEQLFMIGSIRVTVDQDTAIAVIKWDGEKWENLYFPESIYGNPLPSTVCWYQGDMYIGGDLFFDINDTNYILDIAYLDHVDHTWKPVAEGIKGGLWHGITDMVVFKGELYVCGLFRKIDGNVGNKIMRWNGQQWNDVGGGICDINGTVHKMKVHDGKLYIVGIFSCVGDGIPASCIAAWDGVRWCSVGNSVFDNRILTIEFWDDELYIGGGFLEIDGKPIASFAKWVGDHSNDICSEPVSTISEPQTNKLTLWPNPAGETLHIRCKEGKTEDIHLFDVLGREMPDLAPEIIDGEIRLKLEGVPAGLYWVTLRMEGRMWSGKFVKQ